MWGTRNNALPIKTIKEWEDAKKTMDGVVTQKYDMV